MIQRERVNEAAETANDYMTPGNHRAFNDGFDCGVRFAEAEMKTESDRKAIDFAELLYSWESKLEVLNVSIFNLSEAANPNTITTFTVLQYQQMQLTQCINDLKQLFAKFEAERNQQQSELTCPICQSNRILELPDKYQCRKCEHVWERSVK